MKHSKKLFSVVLVLTLALSVMMIGANAYGAATGAGWSVNEDVCTDAAGHGHIDDFLWNHGNSSYASQNYSFTILNGGAEIVTKQNDRGTVSYTLDSGGTLILDSDEATTVTGNGGSLYVAQSNGTVKISGTFADVIGPVTLCGDTTIQDTSLSQTYYKDTTSYSTTGATVTGGTRFHDCDNSHDEYVPAGLTVNDGDVTIANGSPVLQYLKVTGGEVDLNGVGIENIYRSCGYSHQLTSGGKALEVTGGEVTSTDTGTGSNHNTIVGKDYGIYQTGGIIDLTGYTITDTLETGDNNHAGGAIYTNYTGGSGSTDNHTTLTNCDIETVGDNGTEVFSGTSSTTPNADHSAIEVDDGYVTIIANSGSHYIKGSYNRSSYTSGVYTHYNYAYNTALEVNGGTVEVTGMAIDSADDETVPVKVKDAVVTLNGSTVIGNSCTPNTAITVQNTSDNTAELILDENVVVNAYGTGIDAAGKGVTLDIDAGTIKGSGDNGKVTNGIVANDIKAIDITGGTIKAVSCGIDAASVPSFSVSGATINATNTSGNACGISATTCKTSTGHGYACKIENSSITVESTNNDAYGVFLNDSTMQVETDNSTNHTTISATANAQNHVAYGVKATNGSEFYMWEGTTINATHKATIGSPYTKAYGIYNDNSVVMVCDGSIHADVDNTSATVTGVTVYGIYNATTATSDTSLDTTINGGTITVGEHFVNKKGNLAYGMYNASGLLYFKGGTVNVYGDNQTVSYGIYAAGGDASMTGGTIDLKKDMTEGAHAEGGIFRFGTEGQTGLNATKGTADTAANTGHPYITYSGDTNSKVYGLAAMGDGTTNGKIYVYAGTVDVSIKNGFQAIHVGENGEVYVYTNEKVNEKSNNSKVEDDDDVIVFTAKADAGSGHAFYVESSAAAWEIRGNGALFEAKTAFYAEMGGANSNRLSGGTFHGVMNYTTNNIDTLFAVNHYLRDGGSAAPTTIVPTAGGDTSVVDAGRNTINNGTTPNYYTVTDAEWELRYAFEADNGDLDYTMPVDITLDANSAAEPHTWGMLPVQYDVDITAGVHKLNLNGKTLSYNGGSVEDENEKNVLHVNGGELTTYDSVTASTGKIEAIGEDVKAVLVTCGLFDNGYKIDDDYHGAAIKSDDDGVYVTGRYPDKGATVNLYAGSINAGEDGVDISAQKDVLVCVEGGTITATGDGIDIGHNVAGAEINVLVFNGTINATKKGIDMKDAAYVEINGGTITGGTDGINAEAGTVNVSGGTITGVNGVKVSGGTANITAVADNPETADVNEASSPVINGTTNALAVSGGTANITGGTFKGDGEISGDGEANVDAAVDTAPSFQLDKTITVSGGTLNVGATKATKVDSEIKKTAASTVNLCTDSSFKKLTNSYSTETVAAMLNSGVQFIRDEQNESRNVFERNLLTAGPLTATGAETTGYLTLNGTAVTGITLTDSSNGTAKSYYYDEFYFANNKQQTITLTATVRSDEDLRTIVWTVSNGGKMVLTKTEPTVATATGVANTYAVSNTVTLNDLPAGGTYTVTATAQDNAAMSATYTITVNKRALTDSAVSITAPNQVYAEGIVNTTVTVKVNGKTVPAPDESLTFYTVTGDSGTGVETADTPVTATVTASSSAMFVNGSKDVTWKILKKGSTPPPTPGPGGGGGGGAVAPKTYTITCGTGVKADKTSAASGATVKLTVSEGYKDIVVKDAKGNAVTVSGNTFEMPASDVTVSVSKKGVATTYDKCDKGEACVLKAFNDLDAWRWYHDGIHYCLDNGVMNGLGNGEFAPTASTTRGMIFTILARLDGVTITSTGNEWYTDGQAWSVKAGVSDGTDPTGNITREQLAAMLYRYAKLKGYDVSVGEDTNILSYDDAFSVSEYAVGAMQWAVGAGIINGDNNNLKPTTGATRAEVATMLMRFCETVIK